MQSVVVNSATMRVVQKYAATVALWPVISLVDQNTTMGVSTAKIQFSLSPDACPDITTTKIVEVVGDGSYTLVSITTGGSIAVGFVVGTLDNVK